MPYQYKREPLSDDEVNRLINACETFEEKFVVWTLLDTGLRVSEFANLKKDNIQWQERRLIIYGKGGPYGKKTKRRILPMTDRVRRLIDYHFAEHDNTGAAQPGAAHGRAAPPHRYAAAKVSNVRFIGRVLLHPPRAGERQSLYSLSITNH